MYRVEGDKLIISKDVEEIYSQDISKVFSSNVINVVEFEQGSKLRRVCDRAFSYSGNLEKVDFSNCKNLECIDSYAFDSCKNLKEVNVKGCENLKKFGDSCFLYCDNLTEFNFCDLPNLEVIGSACFEFCVNLKGADLSRCEKLKCLEGYAFGHCENMEFIKFPKTESFKQIQGRAITFCNNLENIDLSNSYIEEIGYSAFADCKMLKNINLSNCKNLKYIKNPTYNSNIDTIDISNSKNITVFEMVDCKNIILSFNNKHLIDAVSFDNVFKNKTHIKFVDNKGEKLCEFDSTDEKYGKFDLCSIGNYYTLSKNNLELPVGYVKGILDKNQLKYTIKNIDDFKYFSSLDDNGFTCGELLHIMGYYANCNFEFCKDNKSEMESYKNLLAQDLLKHKIVNKNIGDNNKDYVGKIMQKNADKIAKNHTISELVKEFFKNNIENSPKKLELLSQFKDAKVDVFKLNFAKFFVKNFDDILEHTLYLRTENNKEYDESINCTMSLKQIYENFDVILAKSNKKIITRQNKQRLTIEDCKFTTIYKNVNHGNEKLAEYCGVLNLPQGEFDQLQIIFDKGKVLKDKQVLKVSKDSEKNEIYYKFIEKDDPVSMVLGNITNCCQTYDAMVEPCLIAGVTNPFTCFVTFNYKNKIIGQSWVWYDEEQQLIAFDNIEIPQVFHKVVNNEMSKAFKDCVIRLCDNIYSTMNSNGYNVKNVVIGKSYNDFFPLFQVMPESQEEYECKYSGYTDINSKGQYVAYNDGVRLIKYEKELEM